MPLEKKEFENRGLSLKVVSDNDSPIPDLSIARGVVYCALPTFVPQVRKWLGIAKDAFNHGLLVYLLADDDTTQQHVGREVAEIPDALVRNYRRRTGRREAHEVAENIARHLPGPAANPKLQINLSDGVTLFPHEQFLVTRAFSDCVSVALTPLSGGRSARTFSVRAELMDSVAGPRPLPFFAKLDGPSKIEEEYQRYEQFATHHIPWYLRPNLDAKRCIVGVEQGILVGAFVEYSESLWDAARKGRGGRYIHALFEDTLMGWRRQAHGRDPVRGSLLDAFKDVFKPEKVNSIYVTRAESLGDVKRPEELYEMLVNLPHQSWRNAPMHGDMHGENVRVRNNDAIVIDLAKTRQGPLSGDLASLDVWLSFQCPESSVGLPTREAWTEVVSNLYSSDSVNLLPELETKHIGLEWLHSCIRQIRMIAESTCECGTEYQTAIAIYLLRRTMFAPDANAAEDTYRRAYAFLLGSRLVEALVSELEASA